MVAMAIAPAVSKVSQNGAGVDLGGFNSALVVFECGTLTDGVHTPSLEESDDDVTYTAVAAGDMLGTLAALEDGKVQSVGYIGAKKFVRPVITVAGGPATGAAVSAVVIKGHPNQAPVS